MDDDSQTRVLTKTRRTPRQWFRKYFLDGQELANSGEIDALVDGNTRKTTAEELFVQRNRKYIAFGVPLVVAQFLYWCTSIKHGFYLFFPTHWHMPVTMILGATVAGMTSEGGGAIAFPVMTFILHMSPKNGRDFSIVIQSIAMTMSLFTIIFMRLEIEWRAIVFCVSASIPGIIFGFHVIDPALSAPQKKMLFVSIWSSFAIALWILNRERKRKTVPVIQEFCTWKAVVLLITGFWFAGVFTSFAGSGLDICIFAVTTLLFSVSEKTATPTTVVSMALCSMFGFYWRAVMMGDVEQVVYDYIKVTVPVSITLAPFGSFLGSHFHRQVLANLIYIFELAAFTGFLSTRPPLSLVAASGGILLFGFVLFSFISRKGKQLLLSQQGTALQQIVQQPPQLLTVKSNSCEKIKQNDPLI
ncbi:Protein F26A1.8 [Aphelenchoides fujianensis]|nr:Protein F26A1.8 [Aphelenchoides fujianensis]